MPARFRLRGDRLLFLALVTLLVFLSLLWFALQKSPEFSAQYFTDTALLTVLAIANGLLVLALIYVLFRNLIRLVAERRRGTLGSQFKTKLVVIFLGLTLIPSILLFVAAGKLIELSIKAVFSPEVVEMVDASKSVLDATHDRYKEQARHFAGQVAADVARRQLLSPSQRRRLEPALEERMREYEVDLIVVSAGGEASMTVVRPSLSLTAVNALPWDLVRRAQEGKPADRIDELASGRMVRAALPVPGSETGESAPAVVTVGYLIPDRVAALTAEIDRAASTYFQNKALKGHLEAEYYLILILVAVLVAFAAVWVSIALAKRITVPIQRLAEGTRAVAAGDLDFRLDVETDDEFGILVDSFNRMTRDLRTSKESEERSHRELETTNQELAERRRYMETLLENITPGVISLDRDQRVSTINRSACRILDIESADSARGLMIAELLARPEHQDLLERTRSAQLGETVAGEPQLQIHAAERSQTLTVTFTPLRDPGGEAMGMIIVLEDVTQLIRAEKVAAWQEVARRLAHEIKNPLTPIQLSAQRIAKKSQEKSPDLQKVVEEGTQAIVSEVRGVKSLLDEFARFARLPTVQPAPADIHQIIDQAIALYDGVHPDLAFRREYHANGGPVSLDQEQMKRVCVNLFDNAIRAMDGTGTITVATETTGSGAGLRIAITDQGPGIPPEDRERMFLPYFSTRRKGTGLGLAIVNRIVSDHDGTVRYEQVEPRGGRFIIDIPVRG